MRALVNRQVRLVSRPRGIPQAEHFALATEPMPAPGKGEILIRNHYLSVDPAQRGWANDEGNYSAPVPLDAPMRALTVGEIIESNAAGVSSRRIRVWLVRLADLLRRNAGCRAAPRSTFSLAPQRKFEPARHQRPHGLSRLARSWRPKARRTRAGIDRGRQRRKFCRATRTESRVAALSGLPVQLKKPRWRKPATAIRR